MKNKFSIIKKRIIEKNKNNKKKKKENQERFVISKYSLILLSKSIIGSG
jgi:hypothetical protein